MESKNGRGRERRGESHFKSVETNEQNKDTDESVDENVRGVEKCRR